MKTLERKYSKIERIVAKGKFSTWTFFGTALIAAILGSIVAVVWIFKDKIEALFTKTTPAQYLTDDVMRWVLLGAGGVVLVCFLIRLIKWNCKEFSYPRDNYRTYNSINWNINARIICKHNISFRWLFRYGNREYSWK